MKSVLLSALCLAFLTAATPVVNPFPPMKPAPAPAPVPPPTVPVPKAFDPKGDDQPKKAVPRLRAGTIAMPVSAHKP